MRYFVLGLILVSIIALSVGFLIIPKQTVQAREQAEQYVQCSWGEIKACYAGRCVQNCCPENCKP
ncbi:MAG: hypothetical protein WC497_03370 [Patescibacteria group bacterium]